MTTPLLQIDLLDRRLGTSTRHNFDRGPVRLGRDPANELCLADPTISSWHALLELDAAGAHLRDLGSTNGLHIAGRRSLPHATIEITRRLCLELGPFHLEILHRTSPDRRTSHGALPTSTAPDLDTLHSLLAHLHQLHTPLIAAHEAFESARAAALHTLADDPAATRRLLAEFPTRDTTPPTFPPPDIHIPQDLSPRPSLTIPDLSQRPSPESPPPDLSQRPSPRPLPPDLSQQPSTPLLTLLAPLARALLPDERPPTSLDEARRFLDRVTRVLRDLAAGVAALQHLRLQQTRSFDLVATGPDNPILALSRGDELLAHLLAWRAPTDTSAHELTDCFAVMLAHLRGHVHAALSTACHFAAHLAPPEIERHTRARGPLRPLALWRTYRERFTAYVGDLSSPVLKDTFKTAYRAELAELGVQLVARPSP